MQDQQFSIRLQVSRDLIVCLLAIDETSHTQLSVKFLAKVFLVQRAQPIVWEPPTVTLYA